MTRMNIQQTEHNSVTQFTKKSCSSYMSDLTTNNNPINFPWAYKHFVSILDRPRNEKKTNKPCMS